jgi:hypothetical protein
LRCANAVQQRSQLWVAFAAIVSPVLGVLQSGPQLVADRYTYLATIPFALLAGGGLAWALERAPRARALELGLALFAVGALALASRAQARFWIDSERLWTRAVAVQPKARWRTSASATSSSSRPSPSPISPADAPRSRPQARSFEQGIEHGELPRLFSNLALVEASLADLEPERAAERTARAVQLSRARWSWPRTAAARNPSSTWRTPCSSRAQVATPMPCLTSRPSFAIAPTTSRATCASRACWSAWTARTTRAAALERALALDPSNTKAREWLRALGG